MPQPTTIRDCMHPKPLTVSLDANLVEAIEIIFEYKLTGITVTDEAGQVVAVRRQGGDQRVEGAPGVHGRDLVGVPDEVEPPEERLAWFLASARVFGCWLIRLSGR